MVIASPLTTEAEPVLQRIEVASTLQIPNFHIIGLPAPEVAEARERVRAAIMASDLEFPKRRVVVNLSPASIRKRGTGSDLAIALAILIASQKPELVGNDEATPQPISVATGELGLDGSVRSVGALMRTLYASWRSGAARLLIPAHDIAQTRGYLQLLKLSGSLEGPPPEIHPIKTLKEAWELIKDPSLRPVSSSDNKNNEMVPSLDLYPKSYENVSDQSDQLLPLPIELERTICLAAAGQHHILMLGARGTGKSHAVEWLIRLQPPSEASVRVHHLLIQELSHQNFGSPLPIRRVSSRVRADTLVGGMSAAYLRAGEFSLAHGGVLIADELPEWSRDSREVFREPLERGKITLTRSQGSVELPANFTLVANGNLCPCGGWPTEYFQTKPAYAPPCCCKSGDVRKYLSRLSGPILDRIDMVLLVTKAKKYSQSSLVSLRGKVFQANELARTLWGKPGGALHATELENLLKLKPRFKEYLDQSATLSSRSRHKILRMALTIAIWNYLEGLSPTPEPGFEHFSEALFHRPEVLNL